MSAISVLNAVPKPIPPARAPAPEAVATQPEMNQASAAPEPPLYVRTKAPPWLPRLLAPLIGLGLFVLFWEVLSRTGGQLPSPVATGHAALAVFGDPFYSKGPNDQGIGLSLIHI